MVPSKRKNKLREDKLFREQGWFIISEDMWKESGEVSRKLRFISDSNFPAPLVNQIRGRRIEVRTARELGFEKLADEDLLNRVSEEGFTLITLDADFWSDKKFPLHQSGGLVFIDSTNLRYPDSEGFELLMVILESLGGLQHGVKFKSTSTHLYTKNIGDSGKKVLYEIKAIRPFIYAREVEET